jgi:hypothetical protein
LRPGGGEPEQDQASEPGQRVGDDMVSRAIGRRTRHEPDRPVPPSAVPNRAGATVNRRRVMAMKVDQPAAAAAS